MFHLSLQKERNIPVLYEKVHDCLGHSVHHRDWSSRHAMWKNDKMNNDNWAASSEFGTYRLCEQRRFRRACASAQSRQNLRCSLIQAVSQEEPSDRKPDPWPLWMAGHAQLKFVMTECSKTQIRLTRPNCNVKIKDFCRIVRKLFRLNSIMSCDMTKPTKWVCAQQSLRSACASAESSLCAQWVAKDPSFLHVDSEDWSDWADAQADLSLRWVHTHFVGFGMSRLL